MKKLITLLSIVCISATSFAQVLDHEDPQAMGDPIDISFIHQNKSTNHGWFIHSWDLFDNFYGGDYSAVSHYANLIFPDTTVNYESSGNLQSAWLSSFGGTIDPYSLMYFNPVTSGDSYVLDSLFVLAWYTRVNAAAVDTLIIEIVHNIAHASPDFEHTIFIYAPDTIRTSPVSVYGGPQHGYVCEATSPTKTVIKYPLTAADSTMNNGKHINVPVNLAIPADEICGFNIAFKPGYTWTTGQILYSYSGTHTQELNSFRVGLYTNDNTTSTPHVMWDPYENFNIGAYVNTEIRYATYTGGDTWRNERMKASVNWAFDYGVKISSVQSIGENKEANFTLSPNPCSSFFRIERKNPIDDASWSIYDLSGRLVEEGVSSSATIQINVGGLSNGHYIVRLIDNNKATYQKLIVK
jgi:Secretion system C-terminal sorting domain